MHILVVEDDKDLSNAIKHILEHVGYEVDTVFDGDSGIAFAESGIYDAIIFDVMLPKVDGFKATEILRGKGVSTPILMLTAKGAIPDKIEGFDSGADSYMTKPFSPKKLLARLRALTRRQVPNIMSTLDAGDLSLDIDNRMLSCGDEKVQLGNKEFLFMQLLMKNEGRTLTFNQIINSLWEESDDVSKNNIEAYVSMLRKKLRFLNSSMNISLVKDIGYQLIRSEDVDA